MTTRHRVCFTDPPWLATGDRADPALATVGTEILAPAVDLNFGPYNADCVDEVSTHATALALALERALIPQHLSLTGVRFDIYAGGVPRRLNGCTLGIVGFGRIGRAVARKLGAHYGRVLVFDPYIGRDLPEGYGAAAAESLHELLAASDTVTLHCPLTPQTEGVIDRAALRAMHRDAYLINTARGKLIDPIALREALGEGRIVGAGLDVFSPGDPNADPDWRAVLAHSRVVVTSHRAFLSAEAEASSRRRVAELARDLLEGRSPCLGRVGPRVGTAGGTW